MSYKEEVGVDAGLGLPTDKPSLGRGRELYRLNARETAAVAGQTELQNVRLFWRNFEERQLSKTASGGLDPDRRNRDRK